MAEARRMEYLDAVTLNSLPLHFWLSLYTQYHVFFGFAGTQNNDLSERYQVQKKL